mmetsp:Transcript_75083/g.162382  ORF Transcript_75083/g.162382 Transcript_75083/m.162382 type:complete len:100 (+) Transcript_75083:6-305(+)
MLGGPGNNKMMCGGFTNQKYDDETSQEVIASVFEDLKTKHGGELEPKDVEVVGYSTQVVAGTNYKFELKVKDTLVNMVVYKKLPCYGGTCTITKYELNE